MKQCNLTKSLWTCSIEAALEYHRIITDLFPVDKLLRFVISDSVGRFVTGDWSEESMNLETVNAIYVHRIFRNMLKMYPMFRNFRFCKVLLNWVHQT